MSITTNAADPTKGYLGNDSADWAGKGEKLETRLKDTMKALREGDGTSPIALAEFMAANNDVTVYNNAWANKQKTEVDKAKLILSKD